jgi:hypothetical protein
MAPVNLFIHQFLTSPEVGGLVTRKFLLLCALCALVPALWGFLSGRAGIEGFVIWALTVLLVAAYIRMYIPIMKPIANGFHDVSDFVAVLSMGSDSLLAPYEAISKASGTLKIPPFSWSEIGAFVWRAVLALAALSLSLIFMATSVTYGILADYMMLIILAVMFLTVPFIVLPSMRWLFMMLFKAFLTAGIFLILLRISLSIGVLIAAEGVKVMQPAAVATAFAASDWGSVGPLMVHFLGMAVGLAIAHSPLLFIPIVFRGIPHAGMSIRDAFRR